MHSLLTDSEVGNEDTFLMNRLAERKPEALQDLYFQYKSLLKSVVMQVMHDEAEADDVLQEVLMQVWERPGAFSSEKGRLSNWLATLARRRAIDRVRQRSAYRRATDRFETACKHMGRAFDEIHTVERDAHQDDLKTILYRHLEALPEKQRQAVKLAYLESKTQREISSLTGIPLGTVKTRIELGIRKLSMSLAGSKKHMF